MEYKKFVKRCFTSKAFKENQNRQIRYSDIKNTILFARYYLGPNNIIKKKSQTIVKHFHCFFNSGTLDDLINRMLVADVIGVTLPKLIATYGNDEGTKRFESYCKKQAYTNTFEYKNKKYGMDEDSFAKYNKSRATTLNNMIHKYGNDEGTKRFESYCKKQAYTNTLEYYVEKYGIVEGKKEFDRICFLKGHSLDSYIVRYGDIKIATAKYYEYIRHRTGQRATSNLFWSRASGQFFAEVHAKVYGDRIMYQPFSKEFFCIDTVTKKCYMYDFCNLDRKYIIEYNGDWWHCNPQIYSPDYYHSTLGLTAKQIWAKDRIKQDVAIERGYRVFIVWENDLKTDKEYTLTKLYKFMGI